MARKTPRIYQLRVDLEYAKPPIWRRLLVPSTMSLGELHQVIQIAMGWEGGHLHLFEKGHQVFGDADPEFGLDDAIDEDAVEIGKVLRKEKDRLYYVYDMGDNWQHRIALEKILPDAPQTPLPQCLKGRRACPPEDVGGIGGYEWFLEAIGDPGHDEHEELMEWIGGEFDPEAFDLDEINRELAQFFR